MVLNIRQKQIDGVIRMLHFNSGTASTSKADEDAYKVLVLDQFTKDILAPLIRVNELRKHGVTLHLLIEKPREPIPDVPAIYFTCATEQNVQRIVEDAQRGLYDSFHLNFVCNLPRALMEKLAAGTVGGMCVQRIAKVFDQYLSFISLESGLFTLGMPNVYMELNDPNSQDTQIEAVVNKVVDGLFCALVALGVVPIIRCPKGGAAQHVATQLDAKLRDHLKSRHNLFSESSPGLHTSLTRPLLCLFDRNFELSVAIQHVWTYKPLVHDVLHMQLNRITLAAEPRGEAPGLKRQESLKSYEVGEGDFFWESNGRSPFPKVAEEVEVQLQKYKQAVAEINKSTGSNVDPMADPDEAMAANTRSLMSAVSSLPQLTERKKVIDKHTNLATHLLHHIKGRGLDALYTTEEDALLGKADIAKIEQLIKGGKGSPGDKVRLALVWLLTAEAPPSDPDQERLQAALTAAGADLAAVAYVRRMRRMNLTGKAQSAAGGLDGLAAPSHLLSWANTTFGSGLSSLTKGVKNLLAGEQQAAVTVAVEALMDARAGPEADAYLTFDPKAAAGRMTKPTAPFKEAVVFMIGGGNYLEAESLLTWASRATPPKSIVYGATDLVTGDAFVAQLAELGRKSGAI